LHGNLATAFRFNPLLMVCLPFIGRVGLRLAARQLRGEPVTLKFQARWVWLFLAAAVVFTVWRNVPGSDFAVPPG
jgi:hypothetical protein